MKGEPWKELHGFMCYIVTLKGGPADGMKTIAGNTQTVYFAGHRYRLNADGFFEYAPLRDEDLTEPRP